MLTWSIDGQTRFSEEIPRAIAADKEQIPFLRLERSNMSDHSRKAEVTACENCFNLRTFRCNSRGFVYGLSPSCNLCEVDLSEESNRLFPNIFFILF